MVAPFNEVGPLLGPEVELPALGPIRDVKGSGRPLIFMALRRSVGMPLVFMGWPLLLRGL